MFIAAICLLCLCYSQKSLSQFFQGNALMLAKKSPTFHERAIVALCGNQFISMFVCASSKPAEAVWYTDDDDDDYDDGYDNDKDDDDGAFCSVAN